MQKPFGEANKETGVKQLLFGHPILHRMLKDMIKGEVSRATKAGATDDKKQLKFSQTMAKILLKHFEEAIHGRGVFILLELFETQATQGFVSK